MQMEENQPGSAATGGGRVGTDDTTLIERVEPSSYIAASYRLPARLNRSYSTACLGDTHTATPSSNVHVEEPEEVDRDTTSQKKRS